MTRLILTADTSAAGSLMMARLADRVLPLDFRIGWGPLRRPAELATLFATRSAKHDSSGSHWLDFMSPLRIEEIGGDGLALIDVCERYDTIDLWIDPDPNAQLTLIGLLDYLRPCERIVSKLNLLQADVIIGNYPPEELAKWRLPAVKISSEHLETASAAWQAYRAPTPQDWFSLLARNLTVLPQLRQTVVELLEELPMPATGLGATEMRMLKLISARSGGPFDVFPGHRKRNKRRVFGYWEVGSLLDGLAHCPTPAVSGLDEGPFTLEMVCDRGRHERYRQSRLSLTALGEAVLAKREDFSRHNPIHRWWGGTELTNDHLWRWDPRKRALIAPS